MEQTLLMCVVFQSDEKGEKVYLADMGISKPLGFINNTIVGTLHYMAPELEQGSRYEISCKVDCFSFAVS